MVEPALNSFFGVSCFLADEVAYYGGSSGLKRFIETSSLEIGANWNIGYIRNTK